MASPVGGAHQADYQFILISMDTPCGAKRRAALNYPYQHRIVGVPGSAAPTEVQAKFKFLPSALPRCRSGRIGALWSHRLAMQLVIDLGLKHVVVLQDDARLVRALPPVAELPRDCAVYFGGALRTPGTWSKQQWEFDERREVAVWESIPDGLNEIDFERFTILGSEAIYFPCAAAAQRIVDLLDSSERLIAEDALYRKHRAITKFYFPNIFASSDRCESEITNNVVEIRDLYGQRARKIKDRQARRARKEKAGAADDVAAASASGAPPVRGIAGLCEAA